MNENTIPEGNGAENVFEEAMSPPLTAEQLDEIRKGHEALAQALAQEPTMMADLEGVIGEIARRPIRPETIQELYNSLLYFLDPLSLEYLLTILTGDNYGPFLDAVEELATPETWRWLRRLLALYSSQLRDGYAISGENQNAWRLLNRRVYFDTVTSRWGISFELIKLNGESLMLEETPLTALGLAHGILDSINSIPSDVACDLLEQETVEQFMEECSLFQARYTADISAEVAAVVS